jgi:phosphatidylinositol dimannoside acyltransferase
MNAHDLRDRALDMAFAAGWGAVNRLPERVAAAGFRAAADGAVRRQSTGVRRLRVNLRRVVGPKYPEPEFDVLVKSAMRSYGRYWMETFRLPKMDLDEVAARVHANTEGIEHLDQAMAAGRGLILALPHMGNWDVAAIWLIKHGVPFTTVAERLRPESLYNRFVAFREGIGMRVVALTGGPRPAAEVLAARLRKGECVCLVADRDLSRSGVNVEFFGATARMPAGPALLAATTGATLLSVGLWYQADGGWGQHIGPPVELLRQRRLREQVAVGTQALANAFATYIAAHPSDWHMLQRLWLADLEESGTRGHAPEAPLVPGTRSTRTTGG